MYRGTRDAALTMTRELAGQDRGFDRERLDAAANEAGRAGLVVLCLRVAGAGLAYITQVLMARLMGVAEYGLFATAWVWIAILGHGALFGLSQTTCRFVPAYITRGEHDLARGFLARGASFVAVGSLLIALVWLAVIWLMRGRMEPDAILVLMLAAAVVPVFALQDYAESVARAFNRPILAIAPPYVVRQGLVTAGMLLVVWAGFHADAALAILVTFAATLCVLGIQAGLISRVVRQALPPGPHLYRMRNWVVASLPIAFVDLTTLLIGYADVLVLSLFAPPEAVAIYFAATRLVQFVNFVSYAASAATAARLTASHARGDTLGLSHLVRRTTQWTLLAAGGTAVSVAIASPWLLRMFGSGFEAAVPLVIIMGLGLVIQAAMGPAEDVLNMLGQERACALGSVAALVVAIGFACLLTPLYGPIGAAIAMAIANVTRGGILALLAWRRLGVRTVLGFGAMRSDARASSRNAGHIMTGADIDALSAPAALLAAEALEPNPYYAPRVLNAQRQHLTPARSIRVLTASDDEGLIGWLPYREAGGWLGLRHVPAAWSGDYAMSSTPLLSRRAAAKAATELAQGVVAVGRKGAWLFPRLPTGTMAARLMMDALAREGCRIRTLDEVERAVLLRHGSYDSYMASHVGSGRRKSLRSRRKRLGGIGSLSMSTATQGDELVRAVEAFLVLEKAGWKGRRGTAFASHANTLALAQSMFTPDGSDPEVRADVLELDGRPIAVSLALVSGGRAHLVKTAFDESLRAYAPGLLLDEDIMRQFLDGNGLKELDSASLPGCVLEDLWIDRVRIADVLVITDPALSEEAIDRLVARENARRAALKRLKTLVHDLHQARAVAMGWLRGKRQAAASTVQNSD